ncbi:uncharacterized protein LOC116455505 isoform X1 [Corvus moneduloides]|uniref:uncharacterized protein LOC116455505 isoform X1 n=1 Tax=Corvus moneduloides TaxID=1196302 RepID=UPI0013646171|nr:uncharacterized protein LOC116455505 isoform X1 [Corvus moneduloides]XP_031989343.1 uncharacterized protein LOC116455505 isoform X1 [Corvus moneduloides]
MALALRLLLLLLLAVALPARAAQAAPMRARGADEGAGKASPAAWLHEDLQPLESPAGVSAGRAFPAPFLVDARKTSSHRRGPPRGRNKPRGVKMSLEKSKHRDQMLSGLERRREMEAEAVLKAVFPGGSSGSLAASAAGREAMPGTGTGDWDRDLHHLESLVNDGLRILELDGSEAVDEDDLDSQPEPPEEDEDEEGVSAGRTSPAPLLVPARKPGSHRRGPLRRKNKPRGDTKSLEASIQLDQTLSELERRRDAAGTTTRAGHIRKRIRRVFCWGTNCLIKIMAMVAGGALFLVMCCAGIWYCWKRKRCRSAPSEDQQNNSSTEKSICHPKSSRAVPSPLPLLRRHFGIIPMQIPPKRDPLPQSPLVLLPRQD